MPSLTEKELDEIYDFALQLAKDAGSMLHTAANARIAGKVRSKSVEKASAVDIVTETDEGELVRRGIFVSAVAERLQMLKRLSSGE
jgi:myo-inositol-1(or 4)-monophosphatase